MKVRVIGVAAAFALLIPPAALRAQDAAAEPEFRYVSVSTFLVPFGEERQKALMWVDSVMVPIARLNPNVLSYRVAQHNYGSDANQVVIIQEFPSWEAIQGDCPACDEWFEARQPEEGTDAREAWDGWLADFFRYYSGHKDEIYVVNMNRAK